MEKKSKIYSVKIIMSLILYGIMTILLLCNYWNDCKFIKSIVFSYYFILFYVFNLVIIELFELKPNKIFYISSFFLYSASIIMIIFCRVLISTPYPIVEIISCIIYIHIVKKNIDKRVVLKNEVYYCIGIIFILIELVFLLYCYFFCKNLYYEKDRLMVVLHVILWQLFTGLMLDLIFVQKHKWFIKQPTQEVEN